MNRHTRINKLERKKATTKHGKLRPKFWMGKETF